MKRRLLLVAIVLTQLWFPFRYWDLANHFDATTSWIVVARDVLLLALAAVLAFPATKHERARAGRVQTEGPVPGTATVV